MKKSLKMLMLVLMLMYPLTGCAGEPQPTEEEHEEVEEVEEVEIQTIVIPESLFKFTNTSAEEILDSFHEENTEIEDAYMDGDTIIIEATQDQIDALVDTNNAWVDEMIEDFKAYDASYRFEGVQGEHPSASFWFDENIDSTLQAKTLYGVTSMYAFNMILSGYEDWEVTVTVSNCHTGNVVASGILPDEGISYNNEDWQNSYLTN